MRLLNLVSPALFAVIATAISSDPGSDQESTKASSAESSSSSASSSSSSESSSATPDPVPVGEIWAPKWKKADLETYSKKCASTATLNAEIYTLGEMYPDLKNWAPELKVFYNKQHYPGSWNGVDKHGKDRELLKMDYEDLPYAVREYLKDTPKQRHFSVQDDVVFFAPGAIYPILPLFVDEPEAEGGKIESGCEGVFDDLDNYKSALEDGVVVGRVEHKKGKGKHDVQVTIDAFQANKIDTGRERDEL